MRDVAHCSPSAGSTGASIVVASVAALALIAAGCGDDDSGAEGGAEAATVESAHVSDDGPAASGSTSDAAPVDGTTGGAEPAVTEPEPVDEGGPADEGPAEVSVGDADPARITITDVTGEKEVPVTDQGIYALDELMGTMLLTLGVEPATTAAFFQDPLLAPVLLSEQTDLVEFGSVESIASTRPGLVLGIGHPNFIEIVDELSGVAPTVLPDFTSSWRDQTRLIAQVVDREAEAEAVIGAVDGRIAGLSAEIDDAGLTGQRVAVVQQFGPEWFAYGPTTISGSVVADVGFTRSVAQSGSENFGFLPLAEELVPDETDVPFVFGIATTAGAGTSPIVDNPLVGGADSVVVDVSEAWFNNSALGAWIVLDDLEAIVFGRGEITEIDGAGAAFDDLLESAFGATGGG
ncbi:MAG: ABC transporter substrate-binding protein [Actinomycetota bacterium]